MMTQPTKQCTIQMLACSERPTNKLEFARTCYIYIPKGKQWDPQRIVWQSTLNPALFTMKSEIRTKSFLK